MIEGNRREIPVMHCFDNNYVIPAAVSFYSMLENADPSYFYKLFVLHSDITVQNQAKLRHLVERFENASIEFIEMQHRFNDTWNSLRNTDHLSKEMLYKILAPEIFPQYDKIIITDVDVVFLGDIAPSFDVLQPESECYFAGVRQINPDKSFLRPYYNSYKAAFSEEEYHQLKICGGYLVSNLKKQRNDQMEEVFISYLINNGDRFVQAEQDVFNFCCRDKQIAYLPLNYVVCSYMYDICSSMDITASDPFYTYVEMKNAMEKPVQLHYATKTKPWNSPESTMAAIWFEYLGKTNFQSDYLALHKTKNTNPMPQLYTAQMMEGNACPVKASVLVCSYNHEDLIRKALEGILNQETAYSYEVIVADDASTDNTQHIIREFQKRYPEKMRKCLLRTENVGIGRNYYEALTLVEGEYLALCDGDDCWLDKHKLQKQIDFLEEHKDFSITCSDFRMHTVGQEPEKDSRFGIKQFLHKSVGIKGKYTIRDLVYGRFIASCTVMMRWKLAGRVPEFLKEYRVIDFPLELIHANYGYIMVSEEIMAQYNVRSDSISHQEHSTVVNDCAMVLKEVDQYLGYAINGVVCEYLATIKACEKQAHVKKGEKMPAVIDSSTPTIYRRKELYRQWVPEILQVSFKLLYRGIKMLYKAIVPLRLRNIVSPVFHRIAQ